MTYFCNTSPYSNPAVDRFRCCLGHQLTIPSVAVAPRSGPASLRTAADSDVLPPAEGCISLTTIFAAGIPDYECGDSSPAFNAHLKSKALAPKLRLWRYTSSIYSFARTHKTLRITPAMAAGISDYVWSYEEIAALAI